MSPCRPSAAPRAVAVPLLLFTLLLPAGCHSGSDNASASTASDVPVAPVVTATRTTLANKLNVAGEFIPYEQVELHAKVAGYIRRMNVDIGDKVHKGEVLATLDVPELTAQVTGATAGVASAREQIARAKSEVARAKANYAAVHSNNERLQQAAKAQPGLIAQQELDNAAGRDQAAAAAVDAAKSALAATEQQLGVSRAQENQYSSMADYSRIIAPFDGIVTWRYADPGALIQAGTSNSGSAPVVKVAQISVLRLRIPVPSNLASFVKVGDPATITINSLHKTIQGKVTRTTGALDPSTRTMQVEIDLKNPDDSITPGMYAQVTLDIQRAGDVLAVPVQAVDQSTAQPFVLVVNSSDDIEKREVQTGITTANRVEILSGLHPGEKVIASNLGSYTQGEHVRPHVDTLTSYNASEAQ